jgi:hypothetical protein
VAKSYQEIPRGQIEFLPFEEALVTAFEAVCKKFHPRKSLKFFNCEHCDMLHITCGKKSGIGMDVVSGAWKRRTIQ